MTQKLDTGLGENQGIIRNGGDPKECLICHNRISGSMDHEHWCAESPYADRPIEQRPLWTFGGRPMK